jgi:replicative DNA helicase
MSILTGITTKTARDRALEEINARRTGEKAVGLKLGWNKINKAIGGGIQWNNNLLIAGLSGSGKSTLANIIETAVFDYNPEQDFIVLNFNFETDSAMNMMKKFSADSGFTVGELMSAEQALDDASFNIIQQKAERFAEYPIYYFDVSGTVSDVEHTVVGYYQEYKKPMLCILDHTGLITPENRESDMDLISRLCMMSIKLKKQLPLSFLFLGQLNSNIEGDDRRTNPSLHSPMRSDLYGPKMLYSSMDAVFMPHRPELLKIDYYTTEEYDTRNKMFFHIIKQRFGGVGTVMMDCENIGQNIITEL